MELPDLPKSNCARLVLPGLLDFTSLEEFLPGGFASHMVGWSFLLTGYSPKADGPASTAIWANCQVGDNDGDLPTSSRCLASSTHLSASSNIFSSSLVGEGFLAGDGWCTGEGGLLPFLAITLCASLGWRTHLSPPLSFFGLTFVLAIL